VPAAAALLAALLLTGACTGGTTFAPPDTTPSSSADAAVNSAIPEHYRADAKSFADFRSIDACAMHDTDAAMTASGDQGDEIVPDSDGLNKCTLRLAKGEFQSTWNLYLEVGATYEPYRRRQAAPETIAGRLIYIEKAEGGNGCLLARPLDAKFAIDLRVQVSGGEYQWYIEDGTSCTAISKDHQLQIRAGLCGASPLAEYLAVKNSNPRAPRPARRSPWPASPQCGPLSRTPPTASVRTAKNWCSLRPATPPNAAWFKSSSSCAHHEGSRPATRSTEHASTFGTRSSPTFSQPSSRTDNPWGTT
jgi:hypothetical protein